MLIFQGSSVSLFALLLLSWYVLFILLEVLNYKAMLELSSSGAMLGLGLTSCCTISLQMLLNTSFKLLNQGRTKFLNSLQMLLNTSL